MCGPCLCRGAGAGPGNQFIYCIRMHDLTNIEVYLVNKKIVVGLVLI